MSTSALRLRPIYAPPAIDTWAKLFMEPEGLHPKSATDFKAPTRKTIAGDGYSIILNVGDQMSDLDGGYAEKTFKLPNPFYYIP